MTKTDVNLEVPKFDSNQRDSFSKAIDYVNDFSYNPAQSDPNFVTVMGGNCQALSIIFKEVCDKNSIECTLDGTKTHVYNLVTVDSETYKVDLTNKTVEKLE